MCDGLKRFYMGETMRLSLITTVAMGAMLTMPLAAQAQDAGWYIGAGVGGGTHLSNDLSDGIDGDIDGEGALSAAGRVGYDFGNKWRLEFEGAEIFNEAMGEVGSNNFSSRANLRSTAYMINALYDLEGMDFGSFEPYIGVGAGMVNTSLRAAVAGPGCTNVGATECKVADSDTVFGAQALLGADRALSDNLNWTNQLKIFGTGDTDFQGNQTTGGNDLDIGLGGLLGVTALTGLVWTFGSQPAPLPPVVTAPPPPPPPPPPPVQYIDCPDGSVVVQGNSCPVIQQVVPEVRYTNCPDGSVVVEGSTCPVIQQVVSNLNVCGSSNVGIFNVNTSATPKQMTRLGTLPEFGDSHGLTSDQFFQKLQTRYNSNATDKAYLNYLFKSMGYSNGFADAQSYMFSEDVLPVGTAGLLGLGKQHHYNYSILPSNDRDRQAFRIQSANGQVVHFMKTCGNYFYGCE